MEFWNDIAIDKSWKTLIKFTKEFDVIVIGGWATYLSTKTLKSKDVDVVVDFETLDQIKIKYGLKKNIHLKKYETIVDGVSIDIYVPFFSRLVIPVEKLKEHTTIREGIRIVEPEVLLILKQQAELERKDSVKGQKDRVDILNILINSGIDFKKYNSLVRDYELKDYPKKLKNIIKSAKREFEYLGIKNPRKIKLIKKDLLSKL